MQMLKLKKAAYLAAVISSLTMVGCGDDGSDDTGADTDEDAAAPITKADASAGKADAEVPGETPMDAEVNADGSTTPADGAVTPADATTPVDGAAPATLPTVLSVTGCSTQFIPALCTLSATNGNVTAKCGTVNYTGTFDATTKALTLNAPETTVATGASAGAKVNVACTGKLENDGTITATCTRTQGPTPTADAGTEPTTDTCTLKSDPTILGGLSCLELPATIANTVICSTGAANGGETITAGNCKISQDACRFQADCDNNIVFAGTVTATGISFSRPLKALADAVTPNASSNVDGGVVWTDRTPAFVKGATAPHTCVGAVAADGTLTGNCSAGGANRNGAAVPATSVCPITGKGPALEVCANIAPTNETVFALDSCEMLKDGEGQNPGIGQPLCAYRQNGCVWDLNCANDPGLKWSGRLKAGATKVEWNLQTGTPCEIDFDAQGKMTGKCTVPGQVACALTSIPAVPSGACPVLPVNTDPRSKGCAGGDPLDCRKSAQHGCNWMGICGFSGSYPSEIIAGKTLVKDGLDRFEFNGVNGYTCYVQKATAAEISSTDAAVVRAANEWYGDCTSNGTNGCRNTWTVQNPGGFRKLQVFFDAKTQ